MKRSSKPPRLARASHKFPAFLAKLHLRSGTLVEVLPTRRPAPLPVNLVMPGSRTRPARVRALIGALTGDE
ncbi:hypothetical protein [Burkholderia sp. HI2500]|uniref:hypothetical protein n=1 Tax=Burkholderia sp. HI2500 TaxID=2015358 RepID=UPI00117F6BF0|nr:hypothetical protein [Burkholderia sp. HI2500]